MDIYLPEDGEPIICGYCGNYIVSMNRCAYCGVVMHDDCSISNMCPYCYSIGCYSDNKED